VSRGGRPEDLTFDMTNARLSSSRYGVTAAAVLLGAALGCDASVGALEHKYESASACPQNWQVLFQADFAPDTEMVEQNGILYANLSPSSTPAGLVAIPESGGAPTVLGPTLAAFDSLWIEGDRFVFPGIGDMTDNWAVKLRSVSVNEADPQLLFDAATQRSDGQPFTGLSALTPTDFFWTEWLRGAPNTTIWRASRTDPVPTLLATVAAVLPDDAGPTTFLDVALANDGLVLAADLGVASFVPFDGSPARTLAAPPGFALAVGVDAAGAYWQHERSAEEDATDVLLSPADGGPSVTYWTPPNHIAAERVVRTKDGGSVIWASELFDDKRFHETAWTVDAAGTAKRIACSPADGNYILDLGGTHAVETPDAFYWIIRNLDSETIRIIRVAR
jgi:hypothetical protein